jgi:hypothetical protein
MRAHLLTPGRGVWQTQRVGFQQREGDGEMTSSKPTAADIMVAIAKAEAGDWIDPFYQPIHWYAELYPPPDIKREYPYDGCGHTAAEAMAMAWLHAWAPDALIEGYVEEASVPFEIPDGWRFELTPPWQNQPET